MAEQFDTKAKVIELKNQAFLGDLTGLAQDQHGFIWMGGNEGLVRYDGRNFKRYHMAKSDGKFREVGTVHNIFIDPDNRIWVLGKEGLHRYDEKLDELHYLVQGHGGEDRLFNNNVFNAAYKDADTLYLATVRGLAIYHPSSGELKRPLVNDKKYASFVQTPAVDVAIDKRGWVYVGGSQGLFILNDSLEIVDFHRANAGVAGFLQHRLVRDIHIDRDDRIWIGGDRGLYQYFPETGLFEFYPTELDIRDPTDPKYTMTSAAVWHIAEDRSGNLWVATDGLGVSFLKYGEKSLRTKTYDYSDPASLSSPTVRHIIEDRDGNIWMSLFPGLINLIPSTAEVFKFKSAFVQDGKTVDIDSVLGIVEDEAGRLWLVIENIGLMELDENGRFVEMHTYNKKTNSNLAVNDSSGVHYSENGYLWMPTWTGGLSVVDTNSKRFSRIDEGADFERLTGVTIGKDGYVWVTGFALGVGKFIPGQTDLRKLESNKNLLTQSRVDNILFDGNETIWAGSRNGLFKIDHDSERMKSYLPVSEGRKKASRINAIFKSESDQIWVGTMAGLHYYDSVADKIKRVTASVVSDAAVHSIIEDDEGQLWCGTTAGILKYDPVRQTVQKFDKRDGVQAEVFNKGSVLKKKNGDLVFGSVDGFLTFDPDEVSKLAPAPTVVVTDVRVMNRETKIGKGQPIEKNIVLAEKIELQYDQNFVSFDVSTLNYMAPSSDIFAYKLEGADEEWYDIGVDRTITFFNLTSGAYTLKIKAANKDDVWSEDTKNIAIRVSQPPWLTTPAILMYFLLFCLVCYMGVMLTMRQAQRRNDVTLIAQLQRLNTLKDNILSNTSHELKTPVNGILGLTEILKQRLYQDPVAQEKLTMIADSGRRLSNVINSIVEYSKLTSDSDQSSAHQFDLTALIAVVFEVYEHFGVTKQMVLVNQLDSRVRGVTADPGRVARIMVHLINNAIKFSRFGEVTVFCEQVGEYYQLSVKDNGIGVAPEDKQQIFEPFEQVQHDADREFEGLGMGLALAKQLVEQQGGTIRCETPEEGGTIFSLTLPVCKQALQTLSHDVYREQLETLLSDDLKSITKPTQIVEPVEEVSKEPLPASETDKTMILVVDDEPVNRLVLSGILEQQGYKVFTAENGEESLQVIEDTPDLSLVLMDIMMPKMDGFEAAEHIREKHSAYKLPIIFVTAKPVSEQDLEKSISVGGSDYLTKPVNKEKLMTSMNVALDLRQRFLNMA